MFRLQFQQHYRACKFYTSGVKFITGMITGDLTGSHASVQLLTKLIPLPFARYLTSKSVFFDVPLSQVFEKTGWFWTVTMTFSERYNSLGVIAEKIFPKTLTVSSLRAKTWRTGRKFEFQCFLAFVTWFFNFSKIALLSINRMQDDTFVPNLVQIGQETAEKRWREKKKAKQSNIKI